MPRSPSRSPSASPRGRSRSPGRSLSRDPISDRSRSPSPARRSISRTPPRGRSSRSPTPRRSRSPGGARSRSRSPTGTAKNWRDILDDLFDRGDITRSDVDDGMIADIEDLGEESALCVVQRFSESDFSRIKSVPGFLRGIIRRVRQDGPDRGEGKVDSLPRSVRHQLEDLFEDRKLDRREVDARMVRALNDLPERLAEDACVRFSQSVDSGVRSRQGFMMGIIKRLIEEDRYGRPPPAGYRRGGGGRYDDRRGGYDDKRYDRYDRRGGYDDRRGGGYDDRRGGGYDDRRGGGYDDRRGGGYDDRRGGGYDDRRY